MRNSLDSGKDVLIFQAHRLLYHSTLGLKVIKKKNKEKTCALDDPLQRRKVYEP